MLKLYDEKFKGNNIEEDVLKYTGYSEDQLYNLTGQQVYFKNQKDLKSFKPNINGKYPNINIGIQSPGFEIFLSINLFDRSLEIDKITVHPSKTGRGTEIFFALLESAFFAQLNYIKLTAYKGEWGFRKKMSNGYITWAKLGFTIRDYDIDNFNQHLKNNNLPFKKLDKLVFENFQEWKLYGCTWRGIFYLKNDSENLKILKRYLDKKLHYYNRRIYLYKKVVEIKSRILFISAIKVRGQFHKTDEIENDIINANKNINYLSKKSNNLSDILKSYIFELIQ